METKERAVFALYRGDKLITFGTYEELSKMLNVGIASLRVYSSPKHINKESRNIIRLIQT